MSISGRSISGRSISRADLVAYHTELIVMSWDVMCSWYNVSSETLHVTYNLPTRCYNIEGNFLLLTMITCEFPQLI